MEVFDENFVIRHVGKKIKECRKQLKITQNQLAFEAGIPRVQIGRIERGEVNTTLKSITIISNTLGVHPKIFFDF